MIRHRLWTYSYTKQSMLFFYYHSCPNGIIYLLSNATTIIQPAPSLLMNTMLTICTSPICCILIFFFRTNLFCAFLMQTSSFSFLFFFDKNRFFILFHMSYPPFNYIPYFFSYPSVSSFMIISIQIFTF